VDADSPVELYDLSADPTESTNVAEQHPEIAAQLSQLIKGARTESPVHDFNFPDRRKRSDPAMAHEKN
jgi:arylsulfatase A